MIIWMLSRQQKLNKLTSTSCLTPSKLNFLNTHCRFCPTPPPNVFSQAIPMLPVVLVYV